MLLRLREVLAQFSDFRPSWISDPPDCVASDPRFGMIVHAVSVDEQGKPQYDFPLWLERTGAICVPVDQDDRIVLLRNFRPAVANPARLGEFPVENLQEFGRSSLELPRGFPEPDEAPDDAARREVEEETGFVASEATFLGETNANTTYFPFCNHVYLVRVDSRRPLDRQEKDDERIDEVLLMTAHEVLEQVAHGEIFCGMTKSALMSYFAWREAESFREESAVSASTESKDE